jgi:penicillin amidase
MNLAEREMFKRLGAGDSIRSVCEAAGISREEFDTWWTGNLAARVPSQTGTNRSAVRATVEIERDEWGVPHIYADNDEDLFFGFGYSMAQDRLFQLDFLRRKASGRLSEILGPEGLELDTIARTVGLRRIAEAEWHRLPDETRTLLSSFSAGVNAVIGESGDNLPIEFDLLDYRPAVWSAVDCLAIECEFRWYLTGRMPVIVMPELAKRTLGEGPLYREFLLGEADEESIMPPGSYPGNKHAQAEPVGQAVGDPDASTGSNNWVVSGTQTQSGKPMVASDPHIAFEAVSCWYQAHLCGGSFNVAGMSYVGLPAILIGRNERVVWGITNNICSQRDLYQEQTGPEHPGCFLYDGEWEPARELTEVIHVKGAQPVTQTIRFSRNGPIVDEILPPPGDKTGPLSLKWLGASQGGWLTALLGIDRAGKVDEFREAMRPWHVPTFCLVIADVNGNIGFQASGRIPVRNYDERGYLRGWDPEHQWQGLIPFEAMPGLVNPQRGWMATANNRLAPDDFPYRLDGRWSSGHRAMRIRQMIEQNGKFSRDDFGNMHQDTLSLRAVDCVLNLLEVLAASHDERLQTAARYLQQWDCRSEPNSVGPTIFNVFFTQWANTVAAERFDAQTARLLVNGVDGAAARLLAGDEAHWFQHGDREQKIIETFNATLDLLAERFGPDLSNWTWNKLHRIPLKHVLSSRGDLSELLDHGGIPVKGDICTVCNTGLGPDWSAAAGSGYRMIAELSSAPPGLWAVDGQSQSGHPGSPHYCDQLDDWTSGRYHHLSLDRNEASKTIRRRLKLQP